MRQNLIKKEIGLYKIKFESTFQNMDSLSYWKTLKDPKAEIIAKSKGDKCLEAFRVGETFFIIYSPIHKFVFPLFYTAEDINEFYRYLIYLASIYYFHMDDGYIKITCDICNKDYKYLKTDNYYNIVRISGDDICLDCYEIIKKIIQEKKNDYKIEFK